MRRQVATFIATIVLTVAAPPGCVDPRERFAETASVETAVVETPPVEEDEVDEEVVVEQVVFDSVEDCLQGNWTIDNDAFGAFFQQQDSRVVDISVDGVATMAVDGDTYRMFFEDWGIRYVTGDPVFLLTRNGNETVQFRITADGVVEILERDDQIILDFFSVVGDDDELIGIATTDPGVLPIEGATVECTDTTFQVSLDGAGFVFSRL